MWPRRAFLGQAPRLECIPQTELHLSPRRGAEYFTGGGRNINGHGREPEVGVIKRIKQLPAELQGRPFTNAKVLKKRVVEVLQARSNQDIPTCVAVNERGGWREYRNVKPAANTALSAGQIPIADPVGPVPRSEERRVGKECRL